VASITLSSSIVDSITLGVGMGTMNETSGLFISVILVEYRATASSSAAFLAASAAAATASAAATAAICLM
jgi:hypothetical protein